MAIDLYQSFTNPVTKETFRCLSSTEEAYVMEWIVQPDGYVPFEHVHVHQDEIFHVQARRDPRSDQSSRTNRHKRPDGHCPARGQAYCLQQLSRSLSMHC